MADGEGCTCYAHSASECACDADWTPQIVYDQQAEIERLRKEVAALTIPGEVRVDPDYFQKLRKIEEAAQNLLSVKGRHHTEQAYKKLEDALK
jgi:hypothetical protein